MLPTTFTFRSRLACVAPSSRRFLSSRAIRSNNHKAKAAISDAIFATRRSSEFEPQRRPTPRARDAAPRDDFGSNTRLDARFASRRLEPELESSPSLKSHRTRYRHGFGSDTVPDAAFAARRTSKSGPRSSPSPKSQRTRHRDGFRSDTTIPDATFGARRKPEPKLSQHSPSRGVVEPDALLEAVVATKSRRMGSKMSSGSFIGLEDTESPEKQKTRAERRGSHPNPPTQPPPEDHGYKAPARPVEAEILQYSGAKGLQYETTATESEEQSRRIEAASRFLRYGSSPNLLYSAASHSDHKHNVNLPEILILGASNVGKSTFLNALLGKDGPPPARASPRPGLTTLMNAYGVGTPPTFSGGLLPKGATRPDHSLILMDTPGYGHKSRKDWGNTIIKYIEARKVLRGAFLLMSAEKKLLDHDKWILSTLAERNVQTQVVLTKADKGGKLKNWVTPTLAFAESLRNYMQSLEKHVNNGWKEGSGWDPDILITAAGGRHQCSSNGGMGGTRLALLQMAGFTIRGETVEPMPESAAYEGPVVSFDDVVWKTVGM